jgi:hypothetical protein
MNGSLKALAQGAPSRQSIASTSAVAYPASAMVPCRHAPMHPHTYMCTHAPTCTHPLYPCTLVPMHPWSHAPVQVAYWVHSTLHRLPALVVRLRAAFSCRRRAAEAGAAAGGCPCESCRGRCRGAARMRGRRPLCGGRWYLEWCVVVQTLVMLLMLPSHMNVFTFQNRQRA